MPSKLPAESCTEWYPTPFVKRVDNLLLVRMNNYVCRNIIDPLSKETLRDADPNIVQPSGLIDRYCFILRKTASGSNIYRCRICSHEFTGSKVVAATHFEKN